MRFRYLLILMIVFLLTAPAAMAQMSDLTDSANRLDPVNQIGLPPDADDEICDDADEVIDLVSTCEVTKVTTSLDTAVPTATFFGEFCEMPIVTAGQEDGTTVEAPVILSGTGFVTVDLTGNDDPSDVLFSIECPCETCDIDLTIGAVGPTGATGTQGDQGKLGPQGPQGVSGEKGDKGDTGDVGPQGTQGEIGPAGADGMDGAPGADGTQGEQGKLGPQGVPGDPGIPGETGDVGSTGPQGDAGLTGEQGIQGGTGDVGATGSQGIQGVQGKLGPGGPPGPTGPDDPDQQAMKDWICAQSSPPSFCPGRFVDNGDGTVTDTQSGLIWLKDASCGEIPLTDSNGRANFGNANAGAALLVDGMCGLTDGSSAGDWRLLWLQCLSLGGCAMDDAVGEFATIFAPSCGVPYIPDTSGTGCWSEGNPFSGVQSDLYWSSTTHGSDPSGAWFAGLSYGGVSASSKYTIYYVWPVRDGP